MGVLRFRVFDALLFFFMPVSFCTSSAPEQRYKRYAAMVSVCWISVK
jgi:hypothetical protein